MIDKSSPIPVYYQLKEDIKNKINRGVWKVGECIDSERELSDQYSVSRMTIRQALGELVQEGILVREKGKGTFVCEPKVKQKNIMSFSEIVSKSGRILETRVREFMIIDTPEEFEEIFKFEQLYKIDRLRIVDGDIVANEIVYIPCDYCGYIDEEKLQGSFFSMLKDFGYEVGNADSDIRAVIMNEEYKQLFEIDKEIPLLKIHSNFFTEDGKFLFVEESVYRSDKYVLEVNMSTRIGKLR
ncbi:GntR family transcriptional regulator [Inconstantimicrobium mannanitabidum]|uniref:GntR family transcriptional regulator n=1 Tax=Inconstantimicrobium mannanitabidum TaxID=1604901 RepID=A0ACB5RI84_9CLOT|nr:GntR family transcriptional regulator [Clostridium sp. TW13]GKX68789.1 GntR family transcriptional regulator [Clostridium sp. TW13]